jgi:hypothetical protein
MFDTKIPLDTHTIYRHVGEYKIGILCAKGLLVVCFLADQCLKQRIGPSLTDIVCLGNVFSKNGIIRLVSYCISYIARNAAHNMLLLIYLVLVPFELAAQICI